MDPLHPHQRFFRLVNSFTELNQLPQDVTFHIILILWEFLRGVVVRSLAQGTDVITEDEVSLSVSCMLRRELAVMAVLVGLNPGEPDTTKTALLKACVNDLGDSPEIDETALGFILAVLEWLAEELARACEKVTGHVTPLSLLASLRDDPDLECLVLWCIPEPSKNKNKKRKVSDEAGRPKCKRARQVITNTTNVEC